jgi:hypothetical protein
MGSRRVRTSVPSRSIGASASTPSSARRFCRHPMEFDGPLNAVAVVSPAPLHGRQAPGEEGQDRGGRPGQVSVVEVVGAGIVEVDGLLNQPQAQDTGVEVDVFLGVAAMAVT